MCKLFLAFTKLRNHFRNSIKCIFIIFLSFQLIHINPAHYEDIVEERSITKICGYPLCDLPITTIPKQQYIISRAQNKVYDITERKRYCSNECYKSSLYLKEQILITPLWVRKENDIIPEFKLLSFEKEDADKSEKTKSNDSSNCNNSSN